ncbi:hypothetical protein AKO1_010495 [Acrasis kona]|uniref:Uncharacterized protein n=1 Tax=Acrasis kona TaxID=1008807 RepID=A0AAW2ZJB4_9EUKA
MCSQILQSLILQNTSSALKALYTSHSRVTNQSDYNQQNDKIQQFLNRILNENRIYHNKLESNNIIKNEQPHETKEEFEKKKRQLMILLDQAVSSKMKISKAFGDKLKTFGPDPKSKYGLGWHPGWYEPERFEPEMDCDPFRGACGASSCPCEMFVTWPSNLRDKATVTNTDLDDKNVQYVYNPQFVNPENELCLECHHPKSEHVLATKKDRSSLKEFNPDMIGKYGIDYFGMNKHPADIPLFELTRFYEANPIYAGANPDQAKMALTEIEEPTDKNKGMNAMMDEEDDMFDELG